MNELYVNDMYYNISAPICRFVLVQPSSPISLFLPTQPFADEFFLQLK